MNITIEPHEWITEKKAQKLKMREDVAQRVRDYQAALSEAGIKVSTSRILLRVAEEIGISISTVREICFEKGVIEKADKRGRPALS